MISAFSKAFSQLLTDPRMWKLVVLSALVSLLAFLGLWGIMGGLLRWLAQHVDRFRPALEWGVPVVSHHVRAGAKFVSRSRGGSGG